MLLDDEDKAKWFAVLAWAPREASTSTSRTTLSAAFAVGASKLSEPSRILGIEQSWHVGRCVSSVAAAVGKHTEAICTSPLVSDVVAVVEIGSNSVGVKIKNG